MAEQFVVQGSSPNVFDGQTVPESRTFEECDTLDEALRRKAFFEAEQAGYLDRDERWAFVVLQEGQSEAGRPTFKLVG